VGRKLHRKNIEGTAQGKAEGDREPAFFAKAKNKEKKDSDTEESRDGNNISVQDFRNQIWGCDKGGEGNQG